MLDFLVKIRVTECLLWRFTCITIWWFRNQVFLFWRCKPYTCIEHNGTNVAHHYQILYTAVCLKVPNAADSLTEIGGSYGYNKQAVSDSPQRVVFFLASWTTGHQLIMLKISEEILTFCTEPRAWKTQEGVDWICVALLRDSCPSFVEQKYSLDSIKRGAFVDLQRNHYYTVCVLWSHSVNCAWIIGSFFGSDYH